MCILYTGLYYLRYSTLAFTSHTLCTLATKAIRMKKYLLLTFSIAAISCGNEQPVQDDHSEPTPTTTEVKYIGAMRDVMHKGLINGAISLDTLEPTHLYGLGPTERLAGELMVVDGTYYAASVAGDSLIVTTVDNAKPPFFVYANISQWQEQPLPDSIHTIAQLEQHLDAMAKDKPFFFKVVGIADSATIHNVNLSAGSEVHSPDDAHKDLMRFPIVNEQIMLLGAYSTQHQGIFTHHDAHTHIHLINHDKTTMGHLDKISLQKGSTLYIQH